MIWLEDSNRARLSIREAIAHNISNDFRLFEKINEKKGAKNKIQLYELCIFCNRTLTDFKKPFHHRNYKVIELRACCFCLKKFRGKSFTELPSHIRINIKRKIKKFLFFNNL